MKKSRKIAFWCLGHLSVLALGFLVGIALEHRYTKEALTIKETLGGAVALESFYLQYVEVQRERGGYEQHRDALLDYNQLWELGQRSPLISAFMPRFYGQSGRMFNYIQLSWLESEQGNPAAARRYLDLAVDDCTAREPASSYCTPEGLLAIDEASRTAPRRLLPLPRQQL